MGRRKYDLLVLDVSLPDGSGFEFCQRCGAHQSVPIIFLTASDEETSIIMGLDIGGDDYITKPFKLGVLMSRVNALLRRAGAFGAADTELCPTASECFCSRVRLSRTARRLS